MAHSPLPNDLWPVFSNLHKVAAGSLLKRNARAQEAKAKKEAERGAKDAAAKGNAAEGADADDRAGAAKKTEAKAEPGVKPEQANGQVWLCCSAKHLSISACPGTSTVRHAALHGLSCCFQQSSRLRVPG